MEKVFITETRKKSEMQGSRALDLQKLCISLPGLLEAEYEEKTEEVVFRYDMTGMKSLEELKKQPKEAKYQFLINFYQMRKLFLGYDVALTIDNVFYDENYLPYGKERDLLANSKGREEAFLFYYKTFIGGILGRRYSVTQLQESGIELLKKNKAFRPFYQAETAEELTELLRQHKEQYILRQKRTKLQVSKTEYRIKSICSIVVPILLALCVGLLAYLEGWLVPFQRSVIAANQFYIAGDYVGCIDSMKEIEPDEMDINTKYILAVSYARSESLKREELDQIVSKLSEQSDEKELEYWIYLGRQMEQEAQNRAQSLSDDKLLIYAYMKELDRLQSDTTLEGEEKQTRIETLEKEIESLGEKYAPEE